MAEKKTTKSTEVAKKPVAKKSVEKKVTVKKTAKEVLYINAENVGFRAGDVYQTLSLTGKAMTVAEIAKAAGKTESEILLGIGWLFKEGKVKGEGSLVTLA